MNTPRKHRISTLVATGLGLAFASAAPTSHAQSNYPTHPVKVVVPFGAGSSPDLVARMVSARLAQALGQPFIVENRPGAAGNIGAAQVANALGDGHTLLYTVNSVLCANPHLYSKLPFDPLKSFVPVSMVLNLGYVLMGRPDLPATNLNELLALAKSQPGKLTYASSGDGGGNHIVMELLNSMTGVKMLHVPMTTNLTTAVMSGQVDLAMNPYTTGVPAARGGKVRALGVTLGKRAPAIPDVPAIGEVVPGFVGDGWHAFFASAGSPTPAIERLSAEIRRAIADGEIRKQLTDLSLDPIGSTPSELGTIVQNDYAKWGKVIRDARIKLN